VKVLIVPENPTLDGYILRPIFERLFREIGRPATINVLAEPHPAGHVVGLQVLKFLEGVDDPVDGAAGQPELGGDGVGGDLLAGPHVLEDGQAADYRRDA